LTHYETIYKKEFPKGAKRLLRKIIHVDMDCFYAAVEIRDNPSLKGKPVAVGGRSHKRGVLTTANYEARKFGVRSAMPTSRALRLCPDLILVPPNFQKYREVSQIIREIFKTYTPLVEPLSLDEAFLDVSACTIHSGSATLIAKEIRQKIFEATGLTASAGIAPNKFLAKVASDWRKPNGQFTVSPDQVADFVKDLKLSKIPGVGPKTFDRMEQKGYKTCADLQKFEKTEMFRKFGKWGLQLYHLVRGEDFREVKVSRVRKSLSVERTFGSDLSAIEDFKKEFEKIFTEFLRRFKDFEEKSKNLPQIKGLVLKLKFPDFKQVTREVALSEIPSFEFSLDFASKHFQHFDSPIRLLGIGVRLGSSEDTAASDQLQFEGLSSL
tara:strand:- start:94 stop:1236 length:1143 start_codon:yes stop_codon:yes gene_type:complete